VGPVPILAIGIEHPSNMNYPLLRSDWIKDRLSCLATSPVTVERTPPTGRQRLFRTRRRTKFGNPCNDTYTPQAEVARSSNATRDSGIRHFAGTIPRSSRYLPQGSDTTVTNGAFGRHVCEGIQGLAWSSTKGKSFEAPDRRSCPDRARRRSRNG